MAEYGRPSCVGCGRCIAACPADIDITTVIKMIRGQADAHARRHRHRQHRRVENPYQPHLARIVRIHRMVPDNYLFQLRFVDEGLVERWTHRPGQFVELSVIGTGEAPISISSSPTRRGILEFCVRRAGRTTNALYRLPTNALVGIRGPYGNGFPVEEMEGNDLLIVAGGLGMAPLRSLLWYALDNREKFGTVTLMYGARTPAHMLFRDELVSLADVEAINTLLTVDARSDRHLDAPHRPAARAVQEGRSRPGADLRRGRRPAGRLQVRPEGAARARTSPRTAS